MLESHFLLCTTQSMHNQCQKDSEKLLSTRSFSLTVSKAFFQITVKPFPRPPGLPWEHWDKIPLSKRDKGCSLPHRNVSVWFTPPQKNRGGEGSGAGSGGSITEDAGGSRCWSFPQASLHPAALMHQRERARARHEGSIPTSHRDSLGEEVSP